MKTFFFFKYYPKDILQVNNKGKVNSVQLCVTDAWMSGVCGLRCTPSSRSLTFRLRLKTNLKYITFSALNCNFLPNYLVKIKICLKSYHVAVVLHWWIQCSLYMCINLEETPPNY